MHPHGIVAYISRLTLPLERSKRPGCRVFARYWGRDVGNIGVFIVFRSLIGWGIYRAGAAGNILQGKGLGVSIEKGHIMCVIRPTLVKSIVISRLEGLASIRDLDLRPLPPKAKVLQRGPGGVRCGLNQGAPPPVRRAAGGTGTCPKFCGKTGLRRLQKNFSVKRLACRVV